jgi:hypothetical protein
MAVRKNKMAKSKYTKSQQYTKSQLESLIKEIVNEINNDTDFYDNLCDEGKVLVDKLFHAVGRPRRIEDDIEINITIHSGFILPPGADPDDIDNYDITVKLKNGDVLSYDVNNIEVV